MVAASRVGNALGSSDPACRWSRAFLLPKSLVLKSSARSHADGAVQRSPKIELSVADAAPVACASVCCVWMDMDQCIADGGASTGTSTEQQADGAG